MYRFFIMVIAAVFASAEVVGATEFVVTKTADTLDGACDEDCSLR